MSLEAIYDGLIFNQINIKDVRNILQQHRKTINAFINRDKITKEPMSESELTQLNSLVNILQILYNAGSEDVISDSDYETLHELLIDSGIPRISGDVELNDNKKVNHKFTNLRGSLDKIHYLKPTEKRTNPSRKYLSDWIKSSENKYFKETGEKIDLSNVNVILSSKYNGVSVIVEVDDNGKCTWLTRGDTSRNLASDVSHIMNSFDDIVNMNLSSGIKFEVMITNEDKDYINEISRDQYYRSARQIATSVLNSKDLDFKAKYLYPVPLRIIQENDNIEQIHPDHISKFPTQVCKLSDIDIIKDFAEKHYVVTIPGNKTLDTDGVVITILDERIQRILGRDNNINNFEVAYKRNAEIAYAMVHDVSFYVSQFGIITPVLVINDIKLKGNTINRISLSNKERFDELALCYGDMVKIEYDVIPYASLDENCLRLNRDKIEFTKTCPCCGSELDLNVIQVQCKNPKCKARLIGNILNWCENTNIANVGYKSLEALYEAGLLDKGIRSLYKLKNKILEVRDIPGFGIISAKKIIHEIEAKRRLYDYVIFGSIGIETLSVKTFQSIFHHIPYQTFITLIGTKKGLNELRDKLLNIGGIGERKADVLKEYFSSSDNRKVVMKLLEELSVEVSYGNNNSALGTIVFTGFRSKELSDQLESHGWIVNDIVNKNTTLVVEKEKGASSNKITKATALGIPVITMEELINNITDLKKYC